MVQHHKGGNKTKTGIVKSPLDKGQPYRVWFKGNIIWFARTKEEAEKVLADEKRRQLELDSRALANARQINSPDR